MQTLEPKRVWYWNEKNPDHDACRSGPLTIDESCVAALETVDTGGRRHVIGEYLGGNPLASDPARHPDSHVIQSWLTLTGREHITPSEFHVIFWLAYFIRNEWARLPKRTPGEHKLLYQRIAILCKDLGNALDETGTPYADGAGYGMKHLCTASLLRDSEIGGFVSAYNTAVGKGPETRTMNASERRFLECIDSACSGLSFALPTVQALLERVESVASRLEAQGPLHTQPNKRGAERGYFVRRIGALFQRRYGEQPREVIAALTTIALGEATDRELVAKLLG